MLMRMTSVFALLFISTVAFAQQSHQATPIDQLMEKVHAHHHLVAEMEVPKQADGFDAAAAKSFVITAKKFEFTVSPSPFVVNQGDSVTLDVTVLASDGTQHGFFLEHYFEQTSFFINAGQHRTVTFVANQPGTFTFFCTQGLCGIGHGNMNGILVVQAAPAPPSIDSFNPTTGTTAGGTLVSISGTGFQNGATTKFGGTAAVTTIVNSPTSITATAPSHSAGTVAVSVTNPDSQTASFGSYIYATPGPAIIDIAPASGPNSGGTTLGVTGANFLPGATLTIGGLSATNVIVATDRTLSATTPPGPFDIGANAARDVVITNPDGTSATRSAGFTWTLPAPAVSSIVPNAALPKGGSQVTIFGAGLTTALPVSVTFGGVAGTNVQVIGPTSLTVTVPAHAVGTVNVVLTVGSNSTTAASAFSFADAAKKRRAVKR
jgi:IPT/TIG domain-containing protein